ncbi:MAG: lysozyme inhibitor LprI family protein [Methylococcaceae bacterium]
MLKIKPILLLVSLLVSNSVYSASFDCTKAKTLAETVICSNPQLSDLDELLMTSYKKTLERSEGDNTIKTAQRNWLKDSRNKCQTVACLKQAYTTRIAELNEVVATAQKSTAMTNAFAIAGKYQRYFQGKSDSNSSTIMVKLLSDEQLSINASAVWIGNEKTGNVNTAELEGEFLLTGNKLYVNDGETDGCKFTIIFEQNALSINDDNSHCGGMNVTFNGQYKKLTQ